MGANAGIYAESPYSQGRRRLNHTMSLDARMTNGDDPKIRNYESSNRYLTILVLTHSIACACRVWRLMLFLFLPCVRCKCIYFFEVILHYFTLS